MSSVSLNRSSRLSKTLYSLPVHCLSDADIRMEHEKGIMFSFHRPENQANRYMASLTAFEKSILRDIERPEVYNSKLQASQGVCSYPSTRPFSAPAVTSKQSPSHGLQRRSRSPTHSSALIQQAMSTTTQKGMPCYTVKAVVSTDIIDGRPAPSGLTAAQPWRVARVKSYAVKPSPYGYGEAGKLAFHQRYSWYKYRGFAGKGAKTSWGSNPGKYVDPGSH